MTRLERARRGCNWLIFSEYAKNDSDLAEKMGYRKSSFSQIINGKVKLSNRFIGKLCLVSKNINKVWINTGEGDMLLSKDYPNEDNHPHKIINEPDSVYTMPADQEPGIPLLPVDSLAGFKWKDFKIKGDEVLAYYRVPILQARGAEYVIPVAGNSMYPKYNNGDLLACKPVNDFSFIQWGKPYVLDTDQGIIVKRLFEHMEDQDLLVCKSDNEALYPSFNIRKTSIYKAAIVVGVIGLD